MLKQVLDSLTQSIMMLPGWCTLEKAKWALTTVVEIKARCVVEIGVFGGRSLIPLALAMSELNASRQHSPGYVLGIDPYDPTYVLEEVKEQVHHRWWSAIDYEKVFQGVLKELHLRHLEKHCGLVRSPSENVCGLFPEKSIDFLHIDGCHSETSSCRDVNNWLPKMRPNAVVLIDDTDWESVQKARSLLAENGLLIHSAGSWEAYSV